MSEPQRYGMTIGLRPSHREQYLRLHAAVWPEVEAAMRSAGMRSFTIFLRGDTLFGTYEFVGEDHAAAQAQVAADPATQRWWALTDPCQEQLPGTPDGAQWAPMTEIWHLADAPPTTGVVDAHVHLWDPDVLPYPWLDGTPLQRRRDAEDFAAVSAGVEGLVVVQADTAPDRAVEEVRWVASLFAGSARLVGVVAHAPVETGAAVRAQVDALLGAGQVVGVRRLLQDEAPGFTRSAGFDAGVRVLTEVGLPFDVCVRSHQLPEVVDLVARHPRQVFVLDHLGKPQVGDPAAFEPWREAMTRLAAHPGVSVKLSGLAGELVAGTPVTDVRPYLAAAVEVFGPARLLFGSDWPVMTLDTEYATWRGLVDDALSGLDVAERSAVLGDNARRLYRPVPAG